MTDRPAPAPATGTKPSIDWSHVADEFDWLATDKYGMSWLFGAEPRVTCFGWETTGRWRGAEAFASFKPGTCDWRDSLVRRPDKVKEGSDNG